MSINVPLIIFLHFCYLNLYPTESHTCPQHLHTISTFVHEFSSRLLCVPPILLLLWLLFWDDIKIFHTVSMFSFYHFYNQYVPDWIISDTFTSGSLASPSPIITGLHNMDYNPSLFIVTSSEVSLQNSLFTFQICIPITLRS